MPGAEPFAAGGGPSGALFLHGFGGTPFAMRATAERLAARWRVDVPLLPGHGTSVEDLEACGWEDWTSAAEEAFAALSARCDRVVVVGHSMGGTLACWLAEHHADICGIAVVNPLVAPFDDDIAGAARALLESGTKVVPGAPPDVADSAAADYPTYGATPLAAFLSLNEGVADVALGLGRIVCPVLLLSSREDHVVAPSNGDLLARSVGGPCERVWLERSFHAAMVDYDHEEIEARIEAFAVSVVQDQSGEEDP
jgi:carboxylesterase